MGGERAVAAASVGTALVTTAVPAVLASRQARRDRSDQIKREFETGLAARRLQQRNAVGAVLDAAGRRMAIRDAMDMQERRPLDQAVFSALSQLMVWGNERQRQFARDQTSVYASLQMDDLVQMVTELLALGTLED